MDGEAVRRHREERTVDLLANVIVWGGVALVALLVVGLFMAGWDKQKTDAAAREYHERQNRAARGGEG